MAGWEMSVRLSVSAGPAKQRVERGAPSVDPSRASASSNTALAAGELAAHAWPMVTAWAPCPGQRMMVGGVMRA
jgi:hypothetical protein